MKINKEQFLALSLSMTMSGTAALTSACQKKSVTNNGDSINSQNSDMNVNPTDEMSDSYGDSGMDQYASYGQCNTLTEDATKTYSYAVYDECYVPCEPGEYSTCFMAESECIEKDPTGECIQYQQTVNEAPARDGYCNHWVVSSSSSSEPDIECDSWN